MKYNLNEYLTLTIIPETSHEQALVHMLSMMDLKSLGTNTEPEGTSFEDGRRTNLVYRFVERGFVPNPMVDKKIKCIRQVMKKKYRKVV